MRNFENGLYLAVIVEQGSKMTPAGNPMVTFKIRPSHSVHDGGNTVMTNELHGYVNVVFPKDKPDQCNDNLDRLRKCGFEGNKFEQLDLVGKTIEVECSDGDDGKGNPKDNWNLPGGGAPLTNDAGVARTLNAIFGRKLQQGTSAPATPASAPETPVPAGSPVDDEDVPF